MDPVFSHIVQKRLSRENENIATEALAYFLSHSKGARRGMMRLLREVVPEMPDLLSRTQANRGQQPSRLVGYVSGYTANAISRRGILDTGVDYPEKPFSSVELLTKIREILDKPA